MSLGTDLASVVKHLSLDFAEHSWWWSRGGSSSLSLHGSVMGYC